MHRVLVDAEIREICDLLIPIIRQEGSHSRIYQERLEGNARVASVRAKAIWKLITYEEYAGELI